MAEPCSGCPTCCRGHGTSVFTPSMSWASFLSHLQHSGQLDQAAQPHLSMRSGYGHPSGPGPSDHTLGTWETPGALTLQLCPLATTSCHICSRPQSAGPSKISDRELENLMLSPPSWNKAGGNHATSVHTPSGLGSGPKVATLINRKFLFIVS